MYVCMYVSIYLSIYIHIEYVRMYALEDTWPWILQTLATNPEQFVVGLPSNYHRDINPYDLRCKGKLRA